MRGSSVAWIFCPSVWPIGPSRTTAETAVGDLRQDEGLKARFERQAVAGRGGGDGGRIGDALSASASAPQGRAVPGGARGGDEGRALRRRLEPPLGGGASATASSLVSSERRPVVRLGGAEGGGEQDRVGARRAEGQEIDEPAAERARVLHVAGLDRPFEPVRIGERADRKGRRQPQHQRQQRGSAGVGRQPSVPPWLVTSGVLIVLAGDGGICVVMSARDDGRAAWAWP